MESVAIPGVARRASRLVMGTVRVEPALWEAFVAAGGTCFDTARHYGDETEAALGRLLERLGIRDSVVLVGKGAHTPNCRPDVVAAQLDRSLELLRTDRVDVYLLHRDDPTVPVGEFVDAVDAEVRAGRATAVGVSNWTSSASRPSTRTRRARAARRRCCSRTSSRSPRCSSPCGAGACAPTRAGTTERRRLCSRGRRRPAASSPAAPRTDELRRSWLSEANRERRSRAEALAEKLGVPTVAVALAWVLARPFPTLAVVGPRSPGELAACLAAADVELDEDELAVLTR